MTTKVHVCTGTCNAVISEEQFNGGLDRCGADDCTMKGQPFVDKNKCDHCGKVYSVGEVHQD